MANRYYILLFILFTLVQKGSSQTFSSKLLDQENNMPIPYAAIVYGDEQGVITNEEGDFTFTMDRDTKPLDSIYISCMGYHKKGFTQNQLKDSTIYLKPGGFNLIGVDVFSQVLTADEIIQRMIDSIPVNYPELPVQKKFFLRQSTYDQLERAKIVLNHSTIPHVNPLSLDSVTNTLPKTSEYHTETLGMLYKSGKKVKLQVLKATEMYDKRKQATYSNLNYRLKKVMKRYVKSDSYFKFKTGPVSTKIDLDTLIGRPELETKLNDSIETSIKLNYLKTRENRLALIENQVFGDKSRLEVIEKRKKYLFFKDKTIQRDGDYFYVIQFEPKGKRKLKGTMLINTLDFALVRIEYENIRPLKAFKLFGVDYREPVYKGWAEYSKMKNGKYELSFSKLQHDFYIDAERPLKIAEKNKYTEGRRQQNEITLNLFITSKINNTFEWVALESKGSSQSMFDMVPQRQIIEVKYKTKYDNDYWEGNTIVAPTSAIRDFAILEK